MQTLSIISFVTNKLEGLTEVLKKLTLNSGHDTALIAGATIGAFIVGCLLISFFANK